MTVNATMTNYTCFGSSSWPWNANCAALTVNVTMTNYTCFGNSGWPWKADCFGTPPPPIGASHFDTVFWFGFVMVVVPNIYLMIIKIPAIQAAMDAEKKFIQTAMRVMGRAGFALLVVSFAVRDLKVMAKFLFGWFLLTTLLEIGNIFHGNPPEPDLVLLPPSHRLVEAGVDLELDNFYVNVSIHWSKALLRFVTQSMLVGYWVYDFWTKAPMPANAGYWHLWAMTLPIKELFLDQMGGSFFENVPQYLTLYQATEFRKDIHQKGIWIQGSRKPMIGKVELVMRALMDFIVNNFFIELIMVIFPLVLMRQSGADFVLNAFGVAFITTLDDLGPDDDRRKLTVITGDDDPDEDSEEALME